MSLSELCREQQLKEQRRLQKLLVLGVLGSIGVHGVAFGLSRLGLWQQPPAADLSAIELIVIEPAVDLADEAQPQPSGSDPLVPLSATTNGSASATRCRPPTCASGPDFSRDSLWNLGQLRTAPQ
jgi:hypothetical protein